ncbi:hypothetical protein L810_0730 [Burkholderia sp. AU4i]|nr:hypothetical protein L810_0730 [Burkholderia sp. AU4i]
MQKSVGLRDRRLDRFNELIDRFGKSAALGEPPGIFGK